ncbi:MAG: OadG family protein, partial [Candidatus Fermentibacter sp.]|nr:OadG family protein [Candidatus Fermentibacter sp.]
MTAGTLLVAAVAQADDALLTQGARVSVVGMVIVFIGLVVLTLTLPQLRRVVERIESRKAARREEAVQEQTVQNPAVTDEEVAAAVC